MPDDEEAQKPLEHKIGMALDALSVEELRRRVALLEAEIERLQAAIAAKQASKVAAEAVFKL